MSLIDKANFAKKFPGKENIGASYSSRLKELKDIKTIENYVKKDLNSLKQEVSGSHENITNNYEKVVTQRQHARWINTHPEKWSNKGIMSKNLFLTEAQKLNIPELQNNKDPYQTVLILLKKLKYLDPTITTSKSISRKDKAEKQKFMALLNFQAEVLPYNTETGKDANSKTLTIDGIIGGGTLKSLIETYKNKENTDEDDNIIEDNRQENTIEEQEILEEDLEKYTGFSIEGNDILLEGEGAITSIDILNKEGEAKSLGGNSYESLIRNENTKLEDIHVIKTKKNNISTQKYYKKTNNKWEEIQLGNETNTSKNDIKTNIEIIDRNIEFINNAKQTFEKNMNTTDNQTEKQRRKFLLSGGTFANFEGKNLWESDTLTSTGTKKISYLKNRLSSKKIEENIEFDFDITNGFSSKGSFQIDEKQTIYYERDEKSKKLIIKDKAKSDEIIIVDETTENKEKTEEETEILVEDPVELNKENIEKDKLKIKVNNKTLSFRLSEFIQIAKTKNGTNIFYREGENYVKIKEKSEVWLLPVKRNTESKKRHFDRASLQSGNLHKYEKNKDDIETLIKQSAEILE